MDVVAGLWDTWEDDAILHDRVPGSTPTPPRCTSWTTSASYFSARGPLTVPRTPQGRPVIIQAGSSGRGPRIRLALGRIDLHRRPGHRGRAQPLRRPEGAHRRRRARSCRGADLPDGLRCGRRVRGARQGTRSLIPQRSGSPHGVADTIVGVDELRLRAARSGRPGDRRAHRVGLRHPRDWCRTCAPISAATRSPCATWPATAPRCCRGRDSSAPASRSPTRWRSGSKAVRATDSSWPQRICPERSRTSCAWWFRNCNDAGCSAPPTSHRRCGDTLGCNDLRSPGGRRCRCLMAYACSTSPRLAAAPLVATYLGEFGADVIKVEEPRMAIRSAGGATSATASA